jgi:hypothetical protein
MLIGAAPLIAWNAVFHWIVLRNFTSSDYAARSVGASVEGFWESIGSLLAANTQFWTSVSTSGVWLRVGQLLFVGLTLFAVWQWVAGQRRARVGCGMLLVLIATTATLYSKSRWGVNAGFSRYLIPMHPPHSRGWRGRAAAGPVAALASVVGLLGATTPTGKADARTGRATRRIRARATCITRVCPRSHLPAADAASRERTSSGLLRHPKRALS